MASCNISVSRLMGLRVSRRSTSFPSIIRRTLKATFVPVSPRTRPTKSFSVKPEDVTPSTDSRTSPALKSAISAGPRGITPATWNPSGAFAIVIPTPLKFPVATLTARAWTFSTMIPAAGAVAPMSSGLWLIAFLIAYSRTPLTTSPDSSVQLRRRAILS